uniref:Uncharacterized protein n=1 Tax=Rhizophora mucronata TaxID=61149 RepID=A0A2P2P7L1_RHIMU
MKTCFCICILLPVHSIDGVYLLIP